MSRHILIPASETGKCYLVEVETNKAKTLRMPDGIFKPEIFNKVKDTRKLRNILYDISKSGISRSKEGAICSNGEALNISHDNAIVDSCNGIFREKYEPFYCILGNYDITF